VKRGHLNIAAKQLAASCLAGCSASPAQDMLGSFFPAWMLCAAAGIVIAIILSQLFGVLGLNRYLLAPPLTYLCIAVAGTLLVWLLWFGH
jgi:YtcA family